MTKLVRLITSHIKLIWKLARGYLIYKVTLFASRRLTKLFGKTLLRTKGLLIATRRATLSLTAAQRTLNRVIRRNPFGLIASAAAIGISFLIDWGLAAQDAADAQRDLNEALAGFETQTEAYKILDTLQKDLIERLEAGKSMEGLLEPLSVKELRAAADEIERQRDAWKKLDVPLVQVGGITGTFDAAAAAEDARRKNLLALLNEINKQLPQTQKQVAGYRPDEILGQRSEPQSSEGQAVLESMKATVTGGRRQQIVNVHIGTAVRFDDLVNQSGEGLEEIKDKVAEVVTEAINEGALQGRTALNER